LQGFKTRKDTTNSKTTAICAGIVIVSLKTLTDHIYLVNGFSSQFVPFRFLMKENVFKPIDWNES